VHFRELLRIAGSLVVRVIPLCQQPIDPLDRFACGVRAQLKGFVVILEG
jgi:hypothetical protein